MCNQKIGQTKYLINNYANIRFLVGMYVNVWNRTPVWRGCLFFKLVWRALLNPPKPGSVSYIFQSDDIYSDFFLRVCVGAVAGFRDCGAIWSWRPSQSWQSLRPKIFRRWWLILFIFSWAKLSQIMSSQWFRFFDLNRRAVFDGILIPCWWRRCPYKLISFLFVRFLTPCWQGG